MHSTDTRVLFSENASSMLEQNLDGFDVIATVNGMRALALDDFFSEVARGLAFPDYFGAIGQRSMNALPT